MNRIFLFCRLYKPTYGVFDGIVLMYVLTNHNIVGRCSPLTLFHVGKYNEICNTLRVYDNDGVAR